MGHLTLHQAFVCVTWSNAHFYLFSSRKKSFQLLKITRIIISFTYKDLNIIGTRMLEYHMIWLIGLWWISIDRKEEVFWERYHIFNALYFFPQPNRCVKNELKYFFLYFQLGSGLFYQMVNLNYGTITMIFSWPEFLVMTRNII